MKKFLAALAIYTVSLWGVGTVLLPASAEASHKVWLYCHKADGDAGYAHFVKDNPYIAGLQGGVHTKYKCYAVGWWSYVYAPWPH